MKKYFFLSLRKVILLSASFLLVFVACKKEGELLPGFAENTSNSNFIDNTLINLKTAKGDSVLSTRISTGLVGTYKDAIFGKVTSSIYIQPSLAINGLSFKGDGATFSIDSVILSLDYGTTVGDISKTQTFEVYRLREKLNLETPYFSNTSISKDLTPIGEITFVPNPDKGVVIIQPDAVGGIQTDSLPPQLRIKIDNSIGEEIINQGGTSVVASNENFTSFFNGLYVTPKNNSSINNNENAILYFGLTSPSTALTIYYTTNNSSAGVTLKRAVSFPVTTNSVRFNSFQHDYSGSEVEQALQDSDSNDVFGYVETMAGVETVIRFPNLTSQFESKVLINKAELVIPVALDKFSPFGGFQDLILAQRDSSNNLQFITDFFEETSYFGGIIDSINGTYTFNIARHVQEVINGTTKNDGLTVFIGGSAVKANRIVFENQENTDSKIKLNLYYTNTN